MSRIIVDANIAFRAIIGHQGELRHVFRPPPAATLIAPRFLIAELFKHKERLLRHTGWDNEHLSRTVYLLFTFLQFEDEAAIPVGTWVEAHRLCRDVDVHDTPYIALALHLDALLWTEDAALKTGLRAKGFTQFFEP
jgi:predicted nucleic acid-binding protein